MGQEANWVDYSGTVAGATVGVTLINHPANPPSPFFFRNYGTMMSCFTLNNAYEVKYGETLVMRFRLLVHEGGAQDVDISGYHQEFCA